MITDLLKPAQQNITGLCKFWFAPADWFRFLSIKYLTNIEIKYIEFETVGDKRWLSGYHNNEITEIETTPKQTDSGVLYESQVNLFLPTDDENLRLQLTRMEQMRFIVMVKESSGTVKILGDKISACQLQFKFVNKPTKKGYDIVFSCENT
ncbi:MAG TPA: hypothetical protein PLS10_13685, partial [Chitinophagales bacterium]|nr:hypothetical protein [Chitinophagales bacterium]